jgi:hypothetical protein
MQLRPCRTCSYSKDCEIKIGLLARQHIVVDNLPRLTAATFKCSKKWAAFQPGTRIQAEMQIMADVETVDGGLDVDMIAEDFDGTVMYIKRDRLIVWMDEPVANKPGTTGNRHIVKLYQHRCEVLDEPARKVCAECGVPEDQKNDGWHCETCNSELIRMAGSCDA